MNAALRPNGLILWLGAVYVEGRLQSRSWEDNDGKRHTSVEIVANEMIMLGDRRASDNQSENSEFEEDEFPF